MAFIGQSARRLEDLRLLTGHGTFVDDVNVAGQAWAHVVRSPHAHAVIDRIDTVAARAVDGVLGIYTHQDIADLGALPCATQVATVAPMIVPPRPALAHGRVRHVGDPVAFVVAETASAARDAAERVVIDYTPLPCVVDAAVALAPDAPMLWDSGNESYRFQRGDRAAVQAAFASAAHVVEIEVVNNRLVIAPIETRAAIGSWTDGVFDLFVTAASVHAIRDQLADSVFRCERNQIRVSAPDVGGGFGIKNCVYPEWVMLLWCARLLRRPVKWVEDRAEDFVSTAQGRDNISHARLAKSVHRLDWNFLTAKFQRAQNGQRTAERMTGDKYLRLAGRCCRATQKCLYLADHRERDGLKIFEEAFMHFGRIIVIGPEQFHLPKLCVLDKVTRRLAATKGDDDCPHNRVQGHVGRRLCARIQAGGANISVRSIVGELSCQGPREG